MPDNTDETARILCTAGSWLKVSDPNTADLFYKALVRRCRKTAIGAQADAMRWFPVLDENGNPKPHKPRSPSEISEDAARLTEEMAAQLPLDQPGSENVTTTRYILKWGESLADVAAIFSAAGYPVSVREILAANPDVLVSQLKVGQRLNIPTGKITAPPDENAEPSNEETVEPAEP